MNFGSTPQRSHAIAIVVLLLIIVALARRNYRINSIEESEQSMEVIMEERVREDSIHLVPFDPNVVELAELRAMGWTKFEALSLLRYRATGKVFRIKEDLISCYGVSDSLYYAMEPYITIGEEFGYKRYEANNYSSRSNDEAHTPQRYNSNKRTTLLAPSKFLVDTVGAEYLYAIGALSRRQGEIFVKWRDMVGIDSFEKISECYVVSDSIAKVFAKWAILTPKVKQKSVAESKPLVDLNRVDSATLRSVIGIGEKSVVAILDYRSKLGGFYSVEQLTELDCIFESNYNKIITQIFVDSCDISKIDINFASAKELSSHPYIAPRLRRLHKIRELKGGWSTIGEMTEDKIFTKEESQRVRPYLHFVVPSGK